MIIFYSLTENLHFIHFFDQQIEERYTFDRKLVMFIDNQKYPLRTYFAHHKKTERLKVQKLETVG